MAGSLRHITAEDGSFRFIGTIDGMRDAYEALEECHAIIGVLCKGDLKKLRKVCRRLNFPEPDVVPVPAKDVGTRSL